MLDNLLRDHKDWLLDFPARPLQNIHPIAITLVALLVGLVGIVALTQRYYGWALCLWLLNRLLDGLDGSVARTHHRQTDLGGYIDILADFIVYAGVPLGLVVGSPASGNYLSLAFLFSSFYVNSASWMYLAAILEKRDQGAKTSGESTTITMPPGIIGGTETIIFYCLFMLWPQRLTLLFGLMGGLVVVTIGQRLVWAVRHLR